MRASEKSGDRQALIVVERHVETVQHLKPEAVEIVSELEPLLICRDASQSGAKLLHPMGEKAMRGE